MPTRSVPSQDVSFGDAVRAVVRAIPAGETRSYQAVAHAAGYPRAARAVARVMAQNYDPEVPCHRVVRSDGSLGGYNRGGVATKYALLRGEGAAVKSPPPVEEIA